MDKVLVAYFSASGETARTAREIASAVGGTLYEIRPEARYTAADLDWTNKRSRSSLEMSNPASRPALAGEMPDLAQYGAVFLGFPIWWGVEPRAVDTFLDRCASDRPAMIPFATSGGSGIEGAERRLRETYPQARWQKGRLLGGAGAASWAKGALGA